MKPDIQYFAENGVWVKPAGAVRVDIVLQGGEGGAATSAYNDRTVAALGRRVNPNGVRASNGEPGKSSASSWAADELEDSVEVTVGKGGRPGGRDGYALIITHFPEAPHV